MTRLLLDSNILVYLYAVLSPFHAATRATIRRLLARGAILYTTPQALYEFWVMATRPQADGGLGFDPAPARAEIRRILHRYPALDDSLVTWEDVIDLAVSDGVIGRRIHDARMAAVMHAHGVSDVLSFDRDMDGFKGIKRHEPYL